MPEEGKGLSSNPNLCAHCTTMTDPVEDAAAQSLDGGAEVCSLPENPEQLRQAA